jgi:transposase
VIEQYDKSVNGESIVVFLTRTRDVYQTSGTIHLILDGAGYYRSSLLTVTVTETAKKLNVRVHYLPRYSPNLDPIERLWKVMNKYARNSQYFVTTTLRAIADLLGSTINDNFQQFKLAF